MAGKQDNALESSKPPCRQVIGFLLFGHQRPFLAFLYSQKVVISEIIAHKYCKVNRIDINFIDCSEIRKTKQQLARKMQFNLQTPHIFC